MDIEPFTFVLERLADLLINEITILSSDAKAELENLQMELQMIQSYLMDIDEMERRASISHVLHTQVQGLREMVPEIEVLIDMFFQDDAQTSQGCYFKRLKTYLSYTSNPLLHNYHMVKRVRDINENIQQITTRMKGYQVLDKLPKLGFKQRPRTFPNISNADFIIGLEEDTRTLVGKLTEFEGNHTNDTTLLAIVGMGGSGKTTLARKLYNDKTIQRQFAYRLWVCVSREWDTTRLLNEMCEQVGLRLPQGETSSPFVNLHRFLQQNSCLLVLDDVWRREALQELLSALLQGDNGGRSHRIIITTRNKKIVKFPTLGRCSIHEARHLTQEESWQLFSMIIRKSWQGMYNLEEDGDFALLGRKMLKKCKGLPLAIVALAGFLCTKNTIQEWEKVKNDVGSRILRDDIGTHDCEALEEILELSYVDLPYCLKPCFLYLGIFPEDYVIDVEGLIQLWIAEGFIRSNQSLGSETLEDVSTEFLDQLILRCMVQVVHKDYGGKVNAIRIHDLMRDLCIKKARDLNFFEALSSLTASDSMSSSFKSHRAIIYKGHSFEVHNPRLRSLVHFGYTDQMTKEIGLPYEYMKVLRVLDLNQVDFKGSLEQIGNLTLLRYVSIEWCSGIQELPQSIKHLRNLLTFTYKGNEVEVPNNIAGKMEQLRHLRLAFNPIIRDLGVEKSKNLQALDAPVGEWLAKELHRLSVLRQLFLSKIHKPIHLKVISNSIGLMSSHLSEMRLHVELNSGLEFDLQNLRLEDCHLLEDLRLIGRIKEQNPLGLFPPNLLSLRIGFSDIKDDECVKGAFQQLTRLRSLVLNKGSYKGSTMTMLGLPQLQELTLRKLESLKEWRIEIGAMPRLQRLYIEGCDQLERIPKEISFVTTLQHFEVTDMPESFCKRLERPTRMQVGGGDHAGEDFHLIQNISSIQINTSFKNVCCYGQQHVFGSGCRCIALLGL